MRPVNDLLFDIAHAARLAAKYVQGVDRASFDADSMMQDAVVQRLLIIGEATKGLPEAWRNQHPTIPWHKMARMRDRLAHNYFDTDYDIVWEVATVEIPVLSAYLQPFVTALLAESEEETGE